MPLPPVIEKYLRQRGISGPWRLTGESRRSFSGAVIVPAFAEEETLFATLADLATQPAEIRHRYLVVVVVNHPAGAAVEAQKENLRTLDRLAGETTFDLPLAWVDAVAPGQELPQGEGVGLARKIGFDLVLERLDWESGPPLLISLDADTRVRPDYYSAIEAHFRQAWAGAAVLPFCHARAASAEQERAITLYELYLRSYALGLAQAGSPYGFHTIGSAFACRAEAYVRAGGMNRRSAGEDFYFLQQMVKTAGVSPLAGTVVFPSPRLSQRTPFGTGRSIASLLAGEGVSTLFHRVDCYRLLNAWLGLAIAAWREPARQVLLAAGEIHPALADYLLAAGFPAIWPRLQRQNRTGSAFATAFHCWFDGLKTRKFIHLLSSGSLPYQSAAEALPSLLSWAGLPETPDPAAQLALLRGCPAGGRPEDGEIDVCLKECNVVGFAGIRQ
ncbi:MAG: hypothetical protein WDA20_03135 [Desulfuromonadales bacterium]